MKRVFLIYTVLLISCHRKYTDKEIRQDILSYPLDSSYYIKRATADFNSKNINLFFNLTFQKEESFLFKYAEYLETYKHINVIDAGDAISEFLELYNAVMIDSIEHKYGKNFFYLCQKDVYRKYHVQDSRNDTTAFIKFY